MERTARIEIASQAWKALFSQRSPQFAQDGPVATPASDRHLLPVRCLRLLANWFIRIDRVALLRRCHTSPNRASASP